jgi:hypothetical protein
MDPDDVITEAEKSIREAKKLKSNKIYILSLRSLF